MTKQPYRVGEGANLALYPRGTKVGDVVHLTDAEALYERDMGRLESVSDDKPAAKSGESKERQPAAEAVAEVLPALDDVSQKLRKTR